MPLQLIIKFSLRCIMYYVPNETEKTPPKGEVKNYSDIRVTVSESTE